MRGFERGQPLIHRRTLVVLVLIGLACSLPFVTSADDQPVPTPPAASFEPSNEPSFEPTTEPTAEPTAEPTVELATDQPSETPGETAGPTAEPTATAEPLPAGRPYIITFARGVAIEAGSALVEDLGGRVDATVTELRMAMIRLPDEAAAATLAADSSVVRLEEDQTRTAEAAPSDTQFTDQWALTRIGWDDVYGVVDPAATTVVAILDTGVAADHPDLAGQLLPGLSYVDGAAPDTDANGHGTWMAGIVGAATDNDTGIAGVAWGAVRILPITVLDADGRGQDSAVIQGLVAAVDSGADVVLLAFSSPDYSRALQSAIDYAWANDVVIVAALGNDGSTSPSYPAGDRGVIGVASTDHGDGLAAGSNSGAAAFIGAPGVDIRTTDRDGGYRTVNGTSAAAAMVAGAAALVRATDPAASNGAVVARLARNAAEPAPATDIGNGRLDLARTLADHNMSAVTPEGAAPTGDGGPFLGPYMAAATATWTGGGGDNNWTNPANWGGTAPVAGDDLVFPGGAARLNNTNDFAAGTSFNSITLSGTGYTLSGNSVALGVGGMTSSAAGSANTVSFAMSFATDRTLTVTDSASTLTLGGIISGAGGVIKAGSGTLALSGVNAFTGATSISAGSVDVQSNAALGGTGTGTTVTLGAAITINGSGLTVAEPLTLNGTGITGGGAVRNLANNNVWSGAVTLASATTVVAAGGTLTMSGAVTTATFTITYDGAGNITKSAGVISGTGGVTKEGAGTLTFSVAHSYTGATTINVGTLKLSIANAVGSSSAVSVASGATFDLGGFSDTVGSIAGAGNVTSTAAGTVTLTTAANTSTTFSGVMSDGSGVVGLTKGGTGTLTWSGANTYSGVTRINAGTLSIGSDAVLGTAPGSPTAGQLTFGGGTLQATASFALSANRGIAMTGAGTFNVDPSMTLTYGGVIAGASTLTKSGTGTLVLSGTNTHTGATTISAGVVRVQSNAALGGTGTGSSVASGAAIEIDGSGLSIAEPITSLIGTGVSSGGAIRNLANDNTWSAAITLGSGGARINSDAGTLTLGGGVTGAGLSLTLGGGGNITESGVIGTTTGGVTKDGSGTVTISAAATYTGATTISVGTLKQGIANAIGASSAVTVASGATFDLAGFSDTIGSLAGAGSVTSSAVGSVTLSSGGLNTSTAYSGVMSNGSGTVGLTKTGTGTLTLSGVNTYGGATTISGGTISIAADSGLGSAPGSPTPGQLAFNGGTLLVSATLTLDANRGVALTGAGSFSVTSPIVLTYGGIIAGSGTLAKVGTGTLVLSGANTYSGATTITAGILSISADANLGTPPASPTAGQLTFGGTATLLATASFSLDSNRGMALSGAATISTNASVSVTYGGVIAGASTLTKTGTGTLILGGTSTYSSVTAVSAGILRVQSNAGLGATSAGTTIASGSAVEIDGSGLSIGEPITSLNGTGISAAGALRNLANDNTWSGALTMVASSRVNSDSGTLTLSGGVTGNTFTLTAGGAGNMLINSVIATTTGGLTKDGAGTLTLSAAATYTGATTVSVGTLKLAVANALSASSAVTVSAGATLDLDGFSETLGSLAGAGSVTSSVAGAVTLTTGGLNTSTTYSGVMSNGSGIVAVVKIGSGILTLSGINTFGGSTSINAGSISIAADSGLGTPPGSPTPGHLTLSSGTLITSVSFTLDPNRGIALAGGGTISPNSGITTTYAGIIAGSATLTKTGTGTLVLSGVNTYSGATTVAAGTLSIAADAALGAAPGSPTAGQLTFSGGTLLASATFTLDPNRGVALTGAGTFSVNAAVTLTYGGVVAGSSTLTKAGTGVLVLSGINTYTGSTTVTAGTLSISADNALGAAPGSPTATQLTFNGGTLQATASFALDVNRGITLTAAGTILVDPSITVSYSGVIAGASTVTKSGTGTLILSGSNTFSGATTVSVGVLRIQNAAALGTAVGTTSVSSGAALEIDGSGLSIAEPIISLTGTGVANAGALRNLANDNAWSGAITLAGTTRINSDGGTLTFPNGIGVNTRALTIGGAGNTSSAALAGTTATLTKDGGGNLTLTAANTYTGTTAISAGTVILGVTNAIGSSSAVTVSAGATLDLAGFSDTIGSLAGAGSVTSSAIGTITLTAGANNTSTTYSGVMSNGLATLSLTKAGTGTLILSGINTFTGATTINGGTISIAADSGLGSAPGAATAGQLTFNGGTLLASASFTLDANRGVALTGAGTFSVTSPIVLTYGGIVAGPGTLAKVGTGTLILSGVNTYTGSTTLTAGTLAVAADTGLGAAPGSAMPGQLTFNGGTLQTSASFTLGANRGIALTGVATINVDPSMTVSYGGVIAGASTLTKSGTGTLILSGTNTHTGTTAVSAGVLRIQNVSALGATSTGTTVASGAALELDGSGMNVAEPITSLNGTGVANAGALRNLANDNTWSGLITLAGTTRINTDSGTFSLSAGINANTRALTLGGAGNWDVSAITGTTATLTKDGAGSLPLYATNTYAGRTTLNGGVVTIASDAALGPAPVVPTASHLSFSGGTLATTTTFALDPNRGINWGTSGGTIDVATGTTLTYAGIAVGSSSSGATVKAGGGSLDMSAATSTSGGLTIAAGTVIAPTAGMFDLNGDLTNNSGVGALVTGAGTVTLSRSGSSQVIGGTYPIDFNGLTISNPSGVSLGYDVTVAGTLTLSAGNITSAPHTLYVASTGSVSRTSGHIVGDLGKYVPTGAPAVTYEVGDATQYAPVTVMFSNVSVAGTLIASTTGGDHANLASSAIDPAQSANRFWTLSSVGLSFTDANAAFTFGAADLDVGADTNDFGVARYASGAWQTLTTQTQTSTSTSATGVTAWGDFAVGTLAAGALDHFTVTAPGTATVGTAFDVTVTAVDAAGNRVGSYAGTITFSSSDPHAAFSPASYAFQATDHGTKTFTGGATLYRAGSQSVSVAQGAFSGTGGAIAVSAGAFVQLQILVPGEAADPGSATGKTGTPTTQTAHAPFSVTVHAVDSYWNVVASTDTVAITSSDANASLPGNAALVAGSATFNVTLETGGATTLTATDLTDGAKTASTSASISVTNTAPSATADNYEMVADNTLVVSAAGVLANDTDAESQPLTVGAPRPASGPSHGSLSLNADGSFSYTPTPGFEGSDSFTYTAADVGTTSTPATVTILVRDHSLISASGWGTSFSATRYVALTYPAYLPPSAFVSGATINFSYRSLDGAGTLCYYIETYDGATLLATHGSATSPISCNSGSSYAVDSIDLGEIDSADAADNLTIRIYMRDSAGSRSQINGAVLGIDYSVQ
jgi:fibronectin-binding autotransporter adhesin